MKLMTGRPVIELTEANQTKLKKLSAEIRERLNEIGSVIETGAEGKSVARIDLNMEHPLGEPHTHQKIIKEVHMRFKMDDGTYACFDDPPGTCSVC